MFKSDGQLCCFCHLCGINDKNSGRGGINYLFSEIDVKKAETEMASAGMAIHLILSIF